MHQHQLKRSHNDLLDRNLSVLVPNYSSTERDRQVRQIWDGCLWKHTFVPFIISERRKLVDEPVTLSTVVFESTYFIKWAWVRKTHYINHQAHSHGNLKQASFQKRDCQLFWASHFWDNLYLKGMQCLYDSLLMCFWISTLWCCL